MARLFSAIELPREIAQDLEMMRGGIEGARWIDRENYHITLSFFGEVTNGAVRDLHDALDSVSVYPFSLRLEGVGQFGKSRPHSVWAGVRPSPQLGNLQAIQDRLARRAGIPTENRKYTPHVTIARVRGARPEDVERYVADHSGYRSAEFPVPRFVLLSSRPSRGGGPYATEEVFPLVA